MPRCLKCNATVEKTRRLMVGRPVEGSPDVWDLRPVEAAFCERCLRGMSRFTMIFSGVMLIGLILGTIAVRQSIEEPGGEVAFVSLLIGAILTLAFFIWQVVRMFRISKHPTRYYKAAWQRWQATTRESVFTLEEFRKLTGRDDE